MLAVSVDVNWLSIFTVSHNEETVPFSGPFKIYPHLTCVSHTITSYGPMVQASNLSLEHFEEEHLCGVCGQICLRLGKKSLQILAKSLGLDLEKEKEIIRQCC